MHRFVPICLVLLAGCQPSPPGTEAAGDAAVPPDVAQAVLVEGTGTYSRPISTNVQAAQDFFDQGLRLAYGYYFPEAIASFQEAARHDDHPMIYWGLAFAIGPVPNSRYFGYPDDPQGEGRKAITRALELADRGTEQEQALIRALAVRYDADAYPDRARRDSAYVAATRALHERFPDDPDIGTLYADAVMVRSPWTYWDEDGRALPGTEEAAEALERAMTHTPDHPGANHLYIHLIESSLEPGRALEQADKLEALMPVAGHVVHMPSHIYVRTGQYGKAIATNNRSVAADERFLEAWGDHPFPAIGTYGLSARFHAFHAYDFNRYAATVQGNYERALDFARKSAAATPQARIEHGPGQRPVATVILVQKAFGKWEDVLQEENPYEGYPYLDGVWHYARGSAYVGLGELQKAEDELARLRDIANAPVVAEVRAMANTGDRILTLAAEGLSGEILEARGDHEGAIEAFQRAVDLEDDLAYMEPPDWPLPMRHYLGSVLLKAGRPGEAEAVYREDLLLNQNNGWSLFGLVQSLQDQGKEAEAAETRTAFEAAWQDADVTLTASRF